VKELPVAARLFVGAVLAAGGATFLWFAPHTIANPILFVILLACSNAPGALAPVLQLVRDAGVNVEYAYGGGPDASPTAALVLGVDDAVRAAAAAGV